VCVAKAFSHCPGTSFHIPSACSLRASAVGRKLRADDAQVEGLVAKCFVMSVLLVYPIYLLLDENDVGKEYLVPTLHHMYSLAARVALKYRGTGSLDLLQSVGNRVYQRTGLCYSMFLSAHAEVLAARQQIFDYGIAGIAI